MSVPATWGITSLQFLILYGALCLLLRWANIVAWSAVERTAPTGEEWPAVDAYDLAMVNGGPRQAIMAALTMLTWRGAIGPGALPTLVHVAGDLGADSDALERAVYNDIRDGQIDARALRHEPATGQDLERIRLALTHDGLLLDPRYTAWTGRLWLWGPVVLFMFGSVRLVAMWQYIDANTNMRLLLFATLGVGIVALSHANDQRRYDGRPLPSARGRSLVQQWRTEDRATIESEDERIALATALADDEEWDPGRVPIPGAAAALPSGGGPLAENCSAPTPPDRPADALLAEDVLLLVCGQARDAGPDPTLCVRLAAALLIELGFRGNVGVEITPDGEEVICVINEAATGDELLDEALELLASTSRQSIPTPSTERLWGLAARRRLRSRGRVRDRDIVFWWWGSWRCAELPELTPTVAQQILTLCEKLHAIPHRVARRLVEGGALREQLAGAWPFELRDQTLHSHSLSEIRGLHTGMRESLLEALTTDGWRHAPLHADLPLHAGAATRAVELIVRKYHDATDTV